MIQLTETFRNANLKVQGVNQQGLFGSSWICYEILSKCLHVEIKVHFRMNYYTSPKPTFAKN